MKKINYSDPFSRKLSCLVTIGMLAATSFFEVQTVTAAEWRLEPELRVGYEYDDNAVLIDIGGTTAEIEGYILEGSATIGYATERTTFDITPRLRSRNYDEEIFDSDDQFLTFDFNHRGLKSNFRIRGNYARESVRTAERADADPDVDDPDEIAGDDTGRVFEIGRRERFWIMPQWRYNFSEKSAFAVRARYTDVDYDDLFFVGAFTPYSDVRFDASLIRGFSARTRWHIRASTRSYEPDNAGDDVDGLGFNIGFDRDLTETTRLRAEVGVEETEPTGGESDSNVVWDINIVKKAETVRLMAQYKRTMNGSGGGRVTARDSFNLSVTKQFFPERLEGRLAIRAYTTERLSSDPGTIDERDYVQFRAQLTYALTRTFSVQGDYRFTYIDRSATPGSDNSNNIALWLIYRPTAMTTSR
jgi:hypothetical protein